MKTVLVYGLKNLIGGIENYLMMMHKYLHTDLRFVFLVEEAEPFIYREQIAAADGAVEFLPERHDLGAYRERFNSLLTKYKGETNVLYVNVGHISFDIIPIGMALQQGYRVITHSHNAMQEPIKRFDYRMRQAILRRIAMYRLRHMDVVRLAVSQQAGDYLYKGRPYEIITPGIEVARFRFDPAVRRAYREKLGIADQLVIGYVGRLVSVKNPLYLIDILRTFDREGGGAKLLILGDGDLREEIAAKAEAAGVKDALLMTGMVDNVPDYLSAMDILLAPSLSEGLGLFIVEAQASGLPCVCTKGTIPTIVDVTGEAVFEDLQAGPDAWARDVRDAVSKTRDRYRMNDQVEASAFNIINASKRLLALIQRVSARG